MKKILAQTVALVALFFAMWYFLGLINWMSLFGINSLTEKTERKLGEIYWNIFREGNVECMDSELICSLDTLTGILCKGSRIPVRKIKIHVLINPEINAFALPDGHLIVYTGLIREMKSPEEICGVLAHELAHLENGHVMKKLVREVGLNLLLTLTSGGGGAEVPRKTAKLLSSTAFDRQMERDADLQAVDYLIQAGISPQPFADFITRLGTKDGNAAYMLTWISTHPEPVVRGRYLRSKMPAKSFSSRSLMSPESWEHLRTKACE